MDFNIILGFFKENWAEIKEIIESLSKVFKAMFNPDPVPELAE